MRSATSIGLPVSYYAQFDADFARDVPAEGFGGWQRADVEFSLSHTAVVLMHAWDTGTRDRFPGWHRAVEYIPRADRICRTVLPPLLAAVRASPMPLFHVVGGGDYYRCHPGYLRTARLAGPAPATPVVGADPSLERLRQFRREKVFPGAANQDDVARGLTNLGFAENAEPLPGEAIAEDSHQLFALCRQAGINHLLYAGFAVNWCLLLSPGGMAEMSRHGLLCSVLRQAVTAVENKETARAELAKDLALWRVAVEFGFVVDVDDLCTALNA
jgi:hypothetical protein